MCKFPINNSDKFHPSTLDAYKRNYCCTLCKDLMTEQKGMTFDHDFCYSSIFLLPSFLEEKKKGE